MIVWMMLYFARVTIHRRLTPYYAIDMLCRVLNKYILFSCLTILDCSKSLSLENIFSCMNTCIIYTLPQGKIGYISVLHLDSNAIKEQDLVLEHRQVCSISPCIVRWQVVETMYIVSIIYGWYLIHCIL